MRLFQPTLLLLFTSYVTAHMALRDPPPFNHPLNPNRNPATPNDTTAEFPLKDKSFFPCRKYLNLLDKPEGKPVTKWTAGTTQKFALEGTSTHWGGSCQASISYDRGTKFLVLHSYPGTCPRRLVSDSQEFNFKLPAELPAGDAIFAWTWFNREREMYMSCSPITIQPGSSPGKKEFLDTLPEILVADIGNGCSTPAGHSAEVLFPNPGTAVESITTRKEYPLELPKGNCGPTASGVGSPAPTQGGNGGQGGSSTPAPGSGAPAPTGQPGQGGGGKTKTITITVVPGEKFDATSTVTVTASGGAPPPPPQQQQHNKGNGGKKR
ncbi:hypothetical protein L873DRAFT_1844417 [Choiromyces venosus 120613-1]|uniref:Lytic polysaccharide monooxygenase n=1 Tax=Choiromyces venosus 120613-1 TaxID=1336337 RepID=A0A3N4JI98_9PEZI|nr:hypothetical protein L873DRAFT_1844417 [Choiromyces venosus 120613-1]